MASAKRTLAGTTLVASNDGEPKATTSMMPGEASEIQLIGVHFRETSRMLALFVGRPF